MGFFRDEYSLFNRYSNLFEFVALCFKNYWINHNSVANDIHCVFSEHSRRNCVQNKFLVFELE
ncbi:hypothetical protein SDC9_110099 [bioreactor metagenome]|uniref:Uncharacterized protein n=1 Tax=bioreactor metagenome TaxID=1076179 RepID=A0A645BCK8_9ZZZZ